MLPTSGSKGKWLLLCGPPQTLQVYKNIKATLQETCFLTWGKSEDATDPFFGLYSIEIPSFFCSYLRMGGNVINLIIWGDWIIKYLIKVSVEKNQKRCTLGKKISPNCSLSSGSPATC